MSEIVRAFIAELDDEALDELARRLAPRLAVLAPATPTSPYMTVEEAANYLRCSKQRVYDLTSQGRLTVVKDGRSNRYRRRDLDAVLALPDIEDMSEAA